MQYQLASVTGRGGVIEVEGASDGGRREREREWSGGWVGGCGGCDSLSRTVKGDVPVRDQPEQGPLSDH